VSSHVAHPPSTAPLREVEPASELAVVVGCHGLVCTLPVRYVERLLRRDEVEAVRLPPRRKGSEPLPQVVAAAGEPFAAWNLGTMLELPPLTMAWVLLRIPMPAGNPVAIALRTGHCLMVQPIPPAVALPAGVARRRGAGLVGAFGAAGLRGKRVDARLGLCLDPTRLWTTAELEGSRAAVDAAYEEPGEWGR
jgi:hypothetical protein